MFGPVRVLYSIRLHAPVVLVAGMASVTLLFVATPFLIPAVADEFSVGEGTAGLISVAQVGAFAVANLVLPRILTPSPRLFRLAATGLMTANLASALAPGFSTLVATRMLAGLAGGAITWVAWGDAMRSPRSMTAVSAAGPLTALIGSPPLAALSGRGSAVVFATLAVAALPLLMMRPPRPAVAAQPGERSRSRSNRVLLAALVLLTAAGAALFVFEAVVARNVHDLSGVAASWGFSLNAATGLLGVRFAKRHRRPGVWLATAGPAAAATVIGGPVWLFYLGLGWWGFAFWMGVPGVLEMLVARSLRPDERAGDAQGLMAVGRALAPAVGGVFADAGAFLALGLVAGSGITLSGLMVVGVQEGRDRLPPTDPRTVAR